MYAVRNASAHGQKVPDSHFSPIAHPFGTVVGLDALAEAATFVIRKTVTEVLRLGLRKRFKDRDARESFWLYEYGLNRKQSRKRLKEMYDSLDHEDSSVVIAPRSQHKNPTSQTVVRCPAEILDWAIGTRLHLSDSSVVA
jgi:hypothetical protein